MLVLLGQRLQGHRHLECAGDQDVLDIFFFNAQRSQLGDTGCGQCVGDVFVKARLNDANGQGAAVKTVGPAFFCCKHVGNPSVVLAL